MKEYFWYSKKQWDSMYHATVFDLTRSLDSILYKNFVELDNGNIKEYTECSFNNNPRNFDDAEFLGCGKWHHSERVF